MCRYVLWEDGSSVWVNLPKKLHDKLIGRQKSLAGVQAMSVGDDGSWFVRFHDGSWDARGPDNLPKTMDDVDKDDCQVVAVEFGSSWFLFYSDA